MKHAISLIGSIALAATLALLACASASAATPSLSIEPAVDTLTFGGDPTSIGGELTAAAGVSAGGHVVKLYARPYPYKRSRIIATTTTAGDGSYAFDGIRPAYNTRYRTAVADEAVAARSASKLIVVFPRTSLKIRVSRSAMAISRVRLKYSSDLPLSLDRNKVTWYFHRVGNPRFVSRDHTRAEEKRKGAGTLLRSRSRFSVPRGDYNFEVTFCIDVPDKRDIGLGSPSKRRGCPKSFRAAGGRAAAERRMQPAVVGSPMVRGR